MKIIFAALIVVAVIATADAKKRCYPVTANPPPQEPVCNRKFEEYSECGSACVKTCEQPSGGICTMQCVRGCFCQEGYIRDSYGQCILPENCPKPACSSNEEWTDCNKFCSDAVNRCENLVHPVACRPSECTSGCICKEGYYRDDNEKCVLKENCPPQYLCNIDIHEVYSQCGANGCQATCDNPTLPQVCRAVCMAGCICEEGYIRDSNGACVLTNECPQVDLID